jgi:DNA-binding HxlR family transcriptional regulator
MTKETRSYNQYCPLARTLDVLGERWTLLIVRELLSGPKRFKDLQDALVGVGTNLLSARLKEMERNGLVSRAKLPPPGVASVYELTEHGRKLDETLLSLIRWGIPLLAQPKKPDEYFLPHWMLHGMLSTFKPARAKTLSESYEFHVDHEVFHVRVHNGEAFGDMGKGRDPVLVWESDSESFMALVFNLMTPQEAKDKGFIKHGAVSHVERVLRIFDPMTALVVDHAA